MFVQERAAQLELAAAKVQLAGAAGADGEQPAGGVPLKLLVLPIFAAMPPEQQVKVRARSGPHAAGVCPLLPLSHTHSTLVRHLHKSLLA